MHRVPSIVAKVAVLLCFCITGSAVGAIAHYQVAALDASGNPLTSVNVGSDFTLQVYVADMRASPQGIFSAYVDVEFDPTLVVAKPNTATHGADYQGGRAAGFTTDGLIDETGGLNGLEPIGGGTFELFSVEMTALAPGLITFSTNPADDSVHATTAYGINTAISESDQVFEATTVRVVPEPAGWILMGLGFGFALRRLRRI